MKSRAALAVFAVLLFSVFVQSAFAALGPVEPLSSSDELLAEGSQIHMSDSGQATAFWLGIAGVPPEAGVLSRTRSAAGGWESAIPITGGNSVSEFDSAVAPSGQAIVAWVSTGKSVLAAYRSSSGVWGEPETVQPATTSDAEPGVRVAINKFGQAVVAFSVDPVGPDFRSAFARYRAADGVWSTVENLSGESIPGGDGLDVIADGLGGFMAYWYRLGGDFRVAVSSRPVGDASVWSGPSNPVTSSIQPTGVPAAASNANGDILLVWRQYIDNSFSLDCPPECGHEEIWAIFKPSGGTWGGPTNVSGSEPVIDGGKRPQVAFDAAGNATVVWVRNDGGDSDAVRTNVRSASGTWSGPSTIHEEEADITVPSLAVDQLGAATLLWRSQDPADTYSIELASRPFGGAWTNPIAQAQSDSPYVASNYPSAAAVGNAGAAVMWVTQETSGVPPTEAFARYAPPIPPVDAIPPGPPATTPAIGTVRILPKKIYRKARVRGSKKKRKTAARIRFSLSEPADVTLTLALRTKGKVVGGKCVRATKRNKRRRSCERVVSWGKPIAAGRRSGAVSIAFKSKGLRKGNYYLTVNAVSPTGQTAVPKRTKLTIG